MVWDLSRLRYTVRKLTGKFDVNQLPDTSPAAGQVTVQNPPSVDDYINDYYLYDMPEDLRTLKLRDFFTFNTLPNCGTYALPQSIYEVYQPIYVDNYQFNFYQYPDQFYQIWPELNFINQFPADSTTATQTFTLSQTPIQQGTVVIGLIPNQGSPSNALETFRDADSPIPLDIPIQQVFTNPGALTGSFGGTGTINYLTGAVSITYANGAPPAGSTITAHYHPYVASRPRDILFWKQQLFIRPIPNDTYLVKMMAYRMPTVVLSAATNASVYQTNVVAGATTNTSAPTFDTVTISGFQGSPQSTVRMKDVPEMNEFWQLISYGAAIKILTEEGDWTEVAALQAIYEKQKNLAQRRTLKQLAHQRIPTVYSNNASRSDTWPLYPMY